MFERYTEQARRALFFARYESSELHSRSIESEHLLLGLIRESKGLVGQLFSRSRVDPEVLRRDIESRAGTGEKIPTSVEIPFSAEVKRILQFGADEADRLQHKHIGTEHLLLAVLREEGSVAASLLQAKGLTIARAREDIVSILRDSPSVFDDSVLRLKLSGYTGPGQELFRNVLFDQLFDSLPKEPQAKVQIYNAEIAPGGYTNWHCHNGATFFIALEGVFEAEFEEGILVKAKAGDVYSEPIGKFHRGHNPHPTMPYLCIGVCLTPPDKEHVTNVPQRPW